MKIFEFHPNGILNIIDSGEILVTLTADEVAELIADYHETQGFSYTLRQLAIGAAGGVVGTIITLVIFYWLFK